MRWLKAMSIERLDKNDLIIGLNNKDAINDLKLYIRSLIKNRSLLVLINENDFEEILDEYRKQYKKITGRTDYYVLNEADADEMMDIANKEFEHHKKNIKTIEEAVNFVLKYCPNNYAACELQRDLEKIKRK